MKRFALSLILICLIPEVQTCVLAQTAVAPSSGDGTSGNPYHIYTLENLYWLSQNSSEWGKHYLQTSHIDASVTAEWDGGAGFSPIGNSTNSFHGSYKGYVYTITNLTINRSGQDYVGLFGYLSRAEIEHIGLVDAIITGNNHTGGLAGYSWLSPVSNCYVTGSVTGNDKTGGLIGYNSLVSPVINSFTITDVTGINETGGLIGTNYLSEVYHCYAAGVLSGSGTDVGGLIGKVIESDATSSFWDTETSGTLISPAGTGATTEEMKNPATFYNAGWDLSDCWALTELVNEGYPFLLHPFQPVSDPPAQGDGSFENPFVIETLENLVWLSINSDQWDKHYIQVADIDAEESHSGRWYNGYGISPIGNDIKRFTGSYHGNGHTISNLYINRPAAAFVGLFGYCVNTLFIKSLKLENVDITGNRYTGGIGGYIYNSNILYCNTTGIVRGIDKTGGLTGYVQNTTIINSFSTAHVEGDTDAGGFAGYSGGAGIYNCYSAGSVTGTSGLGGFIGAAPWGAGTVENCFWDTDASGMLTSAAGTGKTTAEMKSQSTFTNAGWDFTYCWNINALVNNGYPFLLQPINPPSEAPSEGDGSVANPWKIATLENLVWLSQSSSQWNKRFIQVADIDAATSGTEGWNYGAGFTSIGFNYGQNAFRGVYDGNGHSISNLYINRIINNNALFGFTDGGTIKNLYIVNADIRGKGGTAALVGYAHNVSITNCHSSGNIQGTGNTGGLTGSLNYSAVMSNSSSSANITGFDYVGGLTGNSYHHAVIDRCFYTGSIEGNSYVGGLSGKNEGAAIMNSYAIASLAGNSDYVGGLVGENAFLEFYSTLINNCYAAGSVSGVAANTGGLAGANTATITNSFWDTEASGQASSAGGTGKTTLEMKDVATYTDTTLAGLDIAWDFKFNPYNDTADVDIWHIVEDYNEGYPCHRAELNYIITHPVADQTICAGEKAVFSVRAQGIDLRFQWKKNGENIAGADSAVYRIAIASVNNSGHYTCMIASSYDTLFSNPAALVVNPETEITSQPQNQFVLPGTEAVFSVTAQGTNLKYQWIKDGVTEITWGIYPSLYINNAGETDEGTYMCIITGDCGEETSQEATLTLVLTSVPDLSNSTGNWLVYPNPTSGHINLLSQSEDVPEKIQITISDQTGRNIFELLDIPAEGALGINLGNLPSGLYIMKIWNASHSEAIKIIRN